MDADLADKIKSFLADPNAADKIAAVAQTLGVKQGGQPMSAPASIDTAREGAVAPSLPAFAPPKNRSAELMAALRPLIREEKRSKLDAVERAMTVATLFSGLRRGQRL